MSANNGVTWFLSGVAWVLELDDVICSYLVYCRVVGNLSSEGLTTCLHCLCATCTDTNCETRGARFSLNFLGPLSICEFAGLDSDTFEFRKYIVFVLLLITTSLPSQRDGFLLWKSLLILQSLYGNLEFRIRFRRNLSRRSRRSILCRCPTPILLQG